MATPTASAMPLTVALAARCSRRESPRTMPRLKPKIAAIKGATSMAPIITAALFCSKPKVAMADDRPIMTKKSTLGCAPSRIALYTSVCW